jgi:hypothetical protein
MPEGDPGLLDQAWTGWGNWWNPKEVPAGSSYDADTLGLARQSAIGSLGGKILALAQAGLQPAQRAQIMAGLAPGDEFQKALSEGATMRLHAATAKRTEQEMASEAASNLMIDRLIAGKTGAGGGVPAANPGTMPRLGDVAGDPIKTALAALMPAESGGNAGAQNAQGYSGRYQIGSALAADSGVYRPAPGESVADDRGRATNTWRGQWVIPGFEPMTHEQWRSNPQAQQAAAEAAMRLNWGKIQSAGLDKYIGQNIGGVQVTAPGLLQGMWLGGLKGLQTWVTGGGDPADSNRTTVSKWAALKPPGGATMTDASGSTYPGDPSVSSGGGAPFQPPTKPKSLADLSPDQLTLLRAMPATQRAAKILELTSKADSPTLLTPGQSAHLGPGTWQWSPTTGYSRIAEAAATDLNATEKAALGLAPDAIVQRKGDRSLSIVDPGKTTWAAPDFLKAHGFNPDAKVIVGPDGKPTVISEGQHRWASPTEIAATGLPPDARVSIGPNGQPTVIDKGTAPGAPMNADSARGILTQYAPMVRAGTLDPNSPEGQRYQAAHRLLSQGEAVEVELPDGRTVRRVVPKDTGYPTLGAPVTPPDEVVTKQAKPLTEGQAKASVYLGNMEDAEKRIQAVTGKGYNPGNARDNYGQILPGKGLTISKEGQLYRQAQITWYRNKLRWESGASIGEPEAFEEASNYFPRPNDTPETIAQKDAARQSAMRNMGLAAGRGQAGQPAPEQPAATSQITPSVLKDLKARIKAGTVSRGAAEIILRKNGGLGPEWLDAD